MKDKHDHAGHEHAAPHPVPAETQTGEAAIDKHDRDVANAEEHGPLQTVEKHLVKLATILTVDENEGATDTKPVRPRWKCLVTEFIGTLLLMFIGLGSGLKLTEEAKDDRPLVGIALCWAFIIAALPQTLGPYSCHLNPAITLAMLSIRDIPWLDAVLFIPTQCAGCIAGTYLLQFVLPAKIIGDFGPTKIASGITDLHGLSIEVIITGYLLFVICSATDPGRKDIQGSVPLSIGLCVGGIILFAGPFTGASMNPARTLGPCVVANTWENHWVYWVGPIVGAQIGTLLYHFVFRVRFPDKRHHPQTKCSAILNVINAE